MLFYLFNILQFFNMLHAQYCEVHPYNIYCRTECVLQVRSQKQGCHLFQYCFMGAT